MHITPLAQASTHVKPDPVRTRKLLLHATQINKLIGKVERAGYTLMPLDLHFQRGRVKVEIGLAKGKKQHDKRDAEKERDWNRERRGPCAPRSDSAHSAQTLTHRFKEVQIAAAVATFSDSVFPGMEYEPAGWPVPPPPPAHPAPRCRAPRQQVLWRLSRMKCVGIFQNGGERLAPVSGEKCR